MAETATTAIFIDKWHPQKDSRCAISIRITHQRKKKYFPTIHSLTEDQFDALFSSQRPREEAKKVKLELISLEKKAADIIRDMPFFTWEGFSKKFLINRAKAETLDFVF